MLATGEARLHQERLVKLLGMTTSDSDGEALAAIRKCNDMLARHELRWNEIIQIPRPSDQAERSRPGEARHGDREAARDYFRSSRSFFEESLRRQDYFRRTHRNARTANLCAYVRNMSLPLRLLLFPLWAAAAMVDSVVIPATDRRERVVATCCVGIASVACTVVWLQLVSGVLTFLLAV